MSKLFLGSIDLNKIDKKYIVTKDKNGNPFKNNAKYLNIAVWINDQADKYGNDMSIQIGEKGNNIYIGNAKKYVKNDGKVNEINEEDLPF